MSASEVVTDASAAADGENLPVNMATGIGQLIFYGIYRDF